MSITILVIIALILGSILILFYEFTNAPLQMLFIIILYLILTAGALMFARNKSVKIKKQ